MMQQSGSQALPKFAKNLYPHKIEQMNVNIIAALVITAKNWKQSKFPSMGEEISKQWYIHTMKYYSVIKRNKVSSHEMHIAKVKEASL